MRRMSPLRTRGTKGLCDQVKMTRSGSHSEVEVLQEGLSGVVPLGRNMSLKEKGSKESSGKGKASRCSSGIASKAIDDTDPSKNKGTQHSSKHSRPLTSHARSNEIQRIATSSKNSFQRFQIKDNCVANVTVTVLQLTGVLCEYHPSKKPSKDPIMFQNELVVSAVASFGRNSVSSGNYIKTHLPSLPILGLFQPQHRMIRCKACWPAKDSNRDEDDIKHSSFTFSRMLKKENFSTNAGGSSKYAHYEDEPGYQSEFVDVSIGLIQSGELIVVGSTTLVISGEPKSMVTRADLIVRREFVEKQASSHKSKKIKHASFLCDPSRRYIIAENSTLSVEIKVSLQDKRSNSFKKSDNIDLYDGSIDPGLQEKVEIMCQKRKEQFDDTSTMTESTKSGYIVKKFGVGNTLYPMINKANKDFLSKDNSQRSPDSVQQEFGTPTVRTSYHYSTTPIADLLCCLPNVADVEHDLQKLNVAKHTRQSDPVPSLDIAIPASISVSGPADVSNGLNVKNFVRMRQNKGDHELGRNEEGVIKASSVSSKSGNSLRKATQTLHHYADVFGVKAEDLL